MSDDADIQAGLSLLFQRGLELALRIQEDAMAAEPAERARLAVAFHRISRSVRQTAALKSRLEREAAQALREHETEARKARERQVDRRKTQLKAAVGRLIWTEYEKSEAEALKDDLEDLLETEGFADDFLDEPAETQVARLCEALEIQDPPPQGEVSAKPTEGVEAPSHPSRPVSQPPQSLRDSSPSGGASGDHPFSSA